MNLIMQQQLNWRINKCDEPLNIEKLSVFTWKLQMSSLGMQLSLAQVYSVSGLHGWGILAQSVMLFSSEPSSQSL